MKPVLMPLPKHGFDPTESGVTWRILKNSGLEWVFATPDGGPAAADPIMVTGKGLGLLSPSMRADRHGREAYAAMIADAAFARPIRYDAIDVAAYAGLALPGGHAKEMRPYLESEVLQSKVAAFFEAGKPVGAICHGVVLAARARDARGVSVLRDRTVTTLPAWMELLAWNLTRLWMGSYYRTYEDVTTQREVQRTLASPTQFQVGPRGLGRDAPGKLNAGFTVRDRNLLTARWPGDAHRFGTQLAAMIAGAS